MNRNVHEVSSAGRAHPSEQFRRNRSRRTPRSRFLNLFSNIWFGVVLLALLFVYCSIGSAVPAVRQLPWLEMTEFQWFHWWPFTVLCVLFTAVMIVATVRRVPLRPAHAGVWMIHTGIVMLVLGSFYYFGTKAEGDTPVYRRQVSIKLPKMEKPYTIPALPGAAARVFNGPDAWLFEVQSTNSSWEIVSDEHKGTKAYAVNVAVTPPQGESFIRQLLAGFPQYTEDVLPGKGRAVKAVGRKLIEPDLELALEFAPQKYFHLMQTWALFVRRAGEAEWVQRPIEGLPRYHDRIASRDQVTTDPHVPITPRSIDLPVPPVSSADPLASAPVRVTGYARYARMERRWREGGGRLNPVIRFRFASPHGGGETFELAAFDPVRNKLQNKTVEFVWFDDAEMVKLLPSDSRALLTLSVPSADVRLEIPLTSETVVGRSGPFTKLEGTDWEYRILHVLDDMAMPDGRPPVSIVMVEFKTPSENFTRMVADRPESTRDMHGGEEDPHGLGARAAGEVNPMVRTTYRPRSAPIIFAAHPKGLHCVVNTEEGQTYAGEVQVGKPISVLPGLELRVDGYWRHAIAEEKPFIVPPPRRDRDADAANLYAMIKLEVEVGGSVQSKWLHFNPYALPDERYAYGGRFAYLPERFRLADGTWVEVLFSRERMPLPNPVAMEDFDLDTHVGGYTGSALTIRNYVSRLRFLTEEGWTEPVAIAVNNPTDNEGFWFFQSSWDRPSPGNPTGGMNYTGLGVGNREGVYMQLAGCCVSVIGMIFAFYIKPLLKRRHVQSQMAWMSEDGEWNEQRAAAAAKLEPVGEPAAV